MAPTVSERIMKSSAFIERVSKARARACRSNSWAATTAHLRYASAGGRSIGRNTYARLFAQDHVTGQRLDADTNMVKRRPAGGASGRL